MKSSFKILFLLALLMALAFPLSKGQHLPTEEMEASDAENSHVSASETEERTSLRGTSRFLAGVSDNSTTTCGRNPRVCYVNGSGGLDCCKNKCVNLLTDGLNCGKCGKKCSYKKICCEGKCVNPNTSQQHCGKCGNKCNKGSSCEYGMCSYA